MKTSITHLAFLFLATALVSLVFTSCNTFRGVGRDVGHVGHHIERAANH